MTRAALTAVALLSLPAARTQAWVCTRVQDTSGTETGPSVSWFSRTVPYSLFAQGTEDIAGEEERDLLRASFFPWSDAQECTPPHRTTDLQFVETAHLSTRDRVGFDFLSPETNENLLIFRDAGWPHAGQQQEIIALTTTTYNALTGEILDADIEFNSANFNFKACDVTACSVAQNARDADLQNTAVHEIGHLLGLGHTPVEDATMFARASPGEQLKRDLACDDRNGIVFKYPAGLGNGYCQPVAACGMCAPGALDAIPTVSVEDTDDGMGGCDCRTSSSGIAAWAIVGFAARRRRR